MIVLKLTVRVPTPVVGILLSFGRGLKYPPLLLRLFVLS